MPNHNKIFAALALVAVLGFSLPGGARAQNLDLSDTGVLLDGIAAIVNDGVVLLSELEEQTRLIVQRLRGANSAWIDLANQEITSLLGVRPGCSVNNNLYPANGVLNMPNLTSGCTCNYAPVSMACIPASAIERNSAE